MLTIMHQSISWWVRIWNFFYMLRYGIPISFFFGHWLCVSPFYSNLKFDFQIEFYGDFDGSFHKSLELVTDLSGALLGTRSERYIIYPSRTKIGLIDIWTFVWFSCLNEFAFFQYFKTRSNTKAVKSQFHALNKCKKM